MPDTFSLSAGVSFGLLAGIVSGVCYLFANREPKTRRVGGQCIVKSKDHICSRCGGDELGGPLPCICQHHESVKFESGAWFLRQAQRALSHMPWSMSTDKLEQIEEEECCSSSGGERVREFLEAISARLAGGPLEGTRVDPLYDHPAYAGMLSRHRPPVRCALSALADALHRALTHLPHRAGRAHSPSASGASGAHAQLKRLVARVVEEAAALPALARYAAEPHTPTDASTYEDLLATAILNKVIERYQTESGSGGRSSGIHSASASPSPSERSSPRSLTSRDTREITPPAGDDASDWEEGDPTEGLEVPKRVPFPEYGGDIVHTDNEFREFDEVSGSDIQAADGSWEENWLFQKKKIKNIQSAPVPMLVPNSNTQYRALIGDRDADDTTDLSDNGSDAEDQDIEYRSDIQKVVDSKHVIGGKPKIEEILDFEPDSLNYIDGTENNDQENDNVINKDTVDSPQEIKHINSFHENINNNDSKLVLSVDSGPVSKIEFNLKEEIYRTIPNGQAEILSEVENKNNETESIPTNNNGSNTNTLGRSEREMEYEETVSVPVQRYDDSLRRKHFDEPPRHSTPSATKEDDLIPGSIAYRERKKWLNYVEMPNNPYSPEAIKKRLSAKSTSSLFDTLTSKTEEKTSNSETIHTSRDDKELQTNSDNKKLKTSMSTDSVLEDRRTKSPSLTHLRHVVSEDVSQYKRYDRDYYVKEARSSSGACKKGSLSSSSSVSSSINRSTSLETMETSPVSSLNELERTLRSPRRSALSPSHVSHHFAINPIFENPQSRENNFIHSESVADDEEFVRLTIPKPEVTEDLFESYYDIRRSNTMRSEELLIKQFNKIAADRQYTTFAGKDRETQSITTMPGEYNNEIIIEYEDVNENSILDGKVTYTDEDTDKTFEEILQVAYHSDKASFIINDTTQTEEQEKSINIENSLSSGSLGDSIKIYNVQTGEIVKCKPEDKLSERYQPLGDIIHDNEVAPPAHTLIENTAGNKHTVTETLPIIEHSIDDLPELLPNVRELAKKFVVMENLNEPVKPVVPLKRQKSKENILSSDFKDRPANKLTYMHSLTARSISREFREELKLSMATPLTVPGGAKDIPEGEEVTRECSRPGSPGPEPGNIKTKLAFFESLKSKFSSK